MKSSIENPAPGMWSCCLARPAVVVSFADGSAVYSCAADASTVSPERRHPMPELEDVEEIIATCRIWHASFLKASRYWRSEGLVVQATQAFNGAQRSRMILVNALYSYKILSR